jgi:c-di-AMP phosphodiesterase-like protein
MLKQEEPHIREVKNKIETGLQQINKIQQEGFDEETKQKIQACLDEIDKKQQQQNIPYKTKYIRFVFDRERKLLFFTGKFDKKEVPDMLVDHLSCMLFDYRK